MNHTNILKQVLTEAMETLKQQDANRFAAFAGAYRAAGEDEATKAIKVTFKKLFGEADFAETRKKLQKRANIRTTS
jgi:hypothetical protein